VSALAKYPGLAALELTTLLAAGILLWLELVESPPFLPRISRPQRAAIAAIAMWSIWVLAYILGFSGAAWFTGYGNATGHGLSAVADQQIAAGVLWALPALGFMPVIFACAIAWLADSEDPDAELRRISAASSAATTRRSGPKPPRGWQSPPA
jgi:cytochrome c oxidase assembly factor CtaG